MQFSAIRYCIVRLEAAGAPLLDHVDIILGFWKIQVNL